MRLGLLLSDANADLSALHLNQCLESGTQVDDYARYVAGSWGERSYADDYVNDAMLTHGNDGATSGGDDRNNGDTLTATLSNRRLLSRARAYIRTDNGQWLRVTGWFEYTSTDITKDNVVVLHLADYSECRAWADSLIMTRRTTPADPTPVTRWRSTGT